MADTVDDDVEKAVLAAWATDATLPGLFALPPRAGRVKSTRQQPAALPYVTVASEHKESERGIDYRLDRRRVSIIVRGTRSQTVAGVAAVLAVFNRNLGRGEGYPTLAMPSGARFISWIPEKDGELKQEEATRQGEDVWAGEVVGVVTTVRD